MDTMSSTEEIAAAVAFAWERPARTTRPLPPPLRIGVIIMLALWAVAHAGFSFFAVWGLPWLFDAPHH